MYLAPSGSGHWNSLEFPHHSIRACDEGGYSSLVMAYIWRFCQIVLRLAWQATDSAECFASIIAPVYSAEASPQLLMIHHAPRARAPKKITAVMRLMTVPPVRDFRAGWKGPSGVWGSRVRVFILRSSLVCCAPKAGDWGGPRGLAMTTHRITSNSIPLYCGFVMYGLLPLVDFFCQAVNDVFVLGRIEEVGCFARVVVEVEELGFVYVAER